MFPAVNKGEEALTATAIDMRDGVHGWTAEPLQDNVVAMTADLLQFERKGEFSMLTRFAKPAIGHDGLCRQRGHGQSCEGESHDGNALSG